LGLRLLFQFVLKFGVLVKYSVIIINYFDGNDNVYNNVAR